MAAIGKKVQGGDTRQKHARISELWLHVHCAVIHSRNTMKSHSCRMSHISRDINCRLSSISISPHSQNKHSIVHKELACYVIVS